MRFVCSLIGRPIGEAKMCHLFCKSIDTDEYARGSMVRTASENNSVILIQKSVEKCKCDENRQAINIEDAYQKHNERKKEKGEQLREI